MSDQLRSKHPQFFQDAERALQQNRESAAVPPKRTVTPEQEKAIIELFNGMQVFPIWITSRMGIEETDEETYEYVMQITRVLTRAIGQDNISRASIDSKDFPKGAGVFCNHKVYYNQVMAQAVIDAVRLTGVPCKMVKEHKWMQHGKEPLINLMIGDNQATPPSLTPGKEAPPP